MSDFVHLHVHSEYSLLDGYASNQQIVDRAGELGMSAIALTDHGNMYGIIDFYRRARNAGIQPIIGVEAYLTPGDYRARSDTMHHQLLLARNPAGYRNLVKLTTRANLDGFYRKPRIDRELLAQHSEGLIATSSCLAGEIPQAILAGNTRLAREHAAFYHDALGPEGFYLELQLHDNAPELEGVNDELCRIGKELGIPLVVTNDTHFVSPDDLETQQLVMAMGFNQTLDALCARGYAMDTSYAILSADEMWLRFKRYGVNPMENTLRIAEQCQGLDLTFGRVQLPEFEIPEGHNASSYLRLICEQGLMHHLDGNPPDHYRERLAVELDVINQTGFPDYMLIVWDYVKYARNRGIPCLPRGSAGASLVLYCLDITEVDPVENKLLFERFLSPERLEMPDIDIDFADSRRHEVLDYIANKYGRDNTAQIITYGTLGAKAAVRDVGRALGVPLSKMNHVVDMLNGAKTIRDAQTHNDALQQLASEQSDIARVLTFAARLEGRMRQVGTHACGVVISRGRLDDIVPLQHATRDEQTVMAAYDGPTLASIGLLKMDILGLTNLSVVANALEYISQTTGKRMELLNIPLQDKATFESLSRGETSNVFQLESAGMTRYLRELKPTRVQDLYAMVALYRPGPLEQIPVYIHNKNNPQDISYLHPILKPILEDTYGVIVYQEQIMQLLQAIAGYTLGRAYVVLKAIGKKKKELMAQEEPKFKAGCLENGLTQEQADQLWNLIQPFAGYSFNRPHATLYGLLSYQTAYLKVHYPLQYMSAVLNSADSLESMAGATSEALRLGIPVRAPDVNESHGGFSTDATEQGIRFGLSAVKHVGERPAKAIVMERDQRGPFQSLEDFCSRVERQVRNKRVMEALIKVGAFDRMPGTRHQKLAILGRVLESVTRNFKAKQSGQLSLFDVESQESQVIPSIPLPAETMMDDEQRKEWVAWEQDLLGLSLTEHPARSLLLRYPTDDVADMATFTLELAAARPEVTVRGILEGVRVVKTRKKGESMAVGRVQGHTASVDIVVFPRVFRACQELVRDLELVEVTGHLDLREGNMQIIVETCAPPAPLDEHQHQELHRERDVSQEPNDDDDDPFACFFDAHDENGAPEHAEVAPLAEESNTSAEPLLFIALPETADFALMDEVHQILLGNPGNHRVIIVLTLPTVQATLEPRARVAVTDAVLTRLRGVLHPLGPQANVQVMPDMLPDMTSESGEQISIRTKTLA